MKFSEIVKQASELLRTSGRVSYRALKREFNLDDKALDDLKEELNSLVRTEIGSIAKPDIVQWAPGLPKTRSGKIMRRILRKIAENELDNLGDISTLADPMVVDDLIKNSPVAGQ